MNTIPRPAHNMDTIPRRAVPLERTDSWLARLRTDGYVVVSGAVSKTAVDAARRLVWEWLESLGSGISRTEPETWREVNWPGNSRIGYCTTHGGAQSRAAWFLRGLPGVKEAFAALWGTRELITSLDTFIVWRPWWDERAEGTWRPGGTAMHVDQNPVKKPGFHCVQGMVPLYGVDARVGGLELVPRTHGDDVQEELREKYPRFGETSSDFCLLEEDDKYQGKARLVLADPGDLILWDSRLVHGGRVGNGVKGEGTVGHGDTSGDLARCAMTVCMVPRSKASEEILAKRVEAVESGLALNHWPHEYNYHYFPDTDGRNIKCRYEPPQLTQMQRDLL